MSQHDVSRVLIQGATILSMDPAIGDLDEGDILIEGSRITAIARGLEVEGAVETIDAHGCIVIPGFIDTHRHMWEAVIRGCAPHHTISDYFTNILSEIGPEITPRDVYLGNLLSARAALTSGITTVQDISNIQDSRDHTDAAIQGLQESGLRAVFAYGKSFTSMAAHGMALSDDVRRVRSELLHDNDALVTMALATEHGDPDAERHNMKLALELDVHTARHVQAEYPVIRLRELGVILPRTTFIHGNNLGLEEIGVIVDSDGSLSIAAGIEMMMGHGYPMMATAARTGVRVSFSVDVEVTMASDMFTQMRCAYQTARYEELSESDAPPPPTTERDILRFATIGGAETLGFEDRTGSLVPGKQADLVILRADGPDVAPVNDPYGAVVLQMDRAHVDTVMVGGVTVKRGGRLLADSTEVIAEARGVGHRLITAGVLHPTYRAA